MTARLATEFWVRAYLKRLEMQAIPAVLTARGDATAGAVCVKVATLDGTACAYQRSVDLITGARVWVKLVDASEPEVDAALARERTRDRDLWIVEIEDRAGRHLLTEEGLSE